MLIVADWQPGDNNGFSQHQVIGSDVWDNAYFLAKTLPFPAYPWTVEHIQLDISPQPLYYVVVTENIISKHKYYKPA